MKKVVISLSVILIFILLVGCLNYKPYEASQEDDQTGDLSEEEELLQEIAQIEAELDLGDQEEDTILPDLEEMDDEIEENTESEEVEEMEEEEELEETNSIDDYDYILTVDENELVSLNLQVIDPDKDNVTYSFSPPLDKKGSWKTKYGDAGDYLVTITASDGKLTTIRKVKLVVNRVNVPPVIKGVKDIIAKEGDVIDLEPVVTDPNNDPVSLTITEPLKSGTFVTDHTSAGEYQISIVASDGELETKETIKLTISDVNVFPEVKGLKDLKIKEGETVTIKPEITDLDGDEIVLTISEPVGNDGVWKTTFIDHGDYTITVIADDGKDKVTKKIKVTVEDVNMPPDIIDIVLG